GCDEVTVSERLRAPLVAGSLARLMALALGPRRAELILKARVAGDTRLGSSTFCLCTPEGCPRRRKGRVCYAAHVSHLSFANSSSRLTDVDQCPACVPAIA